MRMRQLVLFLSTSLLATSACDRQQPVPTGSGDSGDDAGTRVFAGSDPIRYRAVSDADATCGSEPCEPFLLDGCSMVLNADSVAIIEVAAAWTNVTCSATTPSPYSSSATRLPVTLVSDVAGSLFAASEIVIVHNGFTTVFAPPDLGFGTRFLVGVRESRGEWIATMVIGLASEMDASIADNNVLVDLPGTFGELQTDLNIAMAGFASGCARLSGAVRDDEAFNTFIRLMEDDPTCDVPGTEPVDSDE